MKKKGLIISTIVMVVVLIASLTTATYAWFNANAQAEVTDITVSVGASSNVVIGIKKATSTDGTSATHYANGNITYTAGTAGKLDGSFGGTISGLGTKVNLQSKLYSTGGVFTAAATTTDSEFDGSYNGDHFYCDGTYVSGSGAGTGKVTGAATINHNSNGTLVYAPFGIRGSQDNLKYMWCDITFKTTAEYWGIATATRFVISGAVTYNGRPFDTDTDTGTAGVQPVAVWDTATGYEESQITVTFRFMIVNNAAITNGGTIYRFNIISFIDGTSDNCVQDATQYAALMGINFDASETAPTSGAGIYVIS